MDTEPREGLSATLEAGYAVAVSTEITPELLLEGQARELVHRIQNMRRDAGFDIADYIATYYAGDDIDALIAAHGDYVKRETLSAELVKGYAPSGARTAEQSFDGLSAMIGVEVR